MARRRELQYMVMAPKNGRPPKNSGPVGDVDHVPNVLVEHMQQFYPTFDLRSVRLSREAAWELLTVGILGDVDPEAWAAVTWGNLVTFNTYFFSWMLGIEPYVGDILATDIGVIVLAHELQHVAQARRFPTDGAALYVTFWRNLFTPYEDRPAEHGANQKMLEVETYFSEYGWPPGVRPWQEESR